MGMFSGIFGGPEKKPDPSEQNEGGKFMAIPKEVPGSITEEESGFTEQRRLEREKLEILTTEIESDPNHPMRGDLEKLNERLRELQ